MNTLNETLINTINDNVYCGLIDNGIEVANAYVLANENLDIIEIMEREEFLGSPVVASDEFASLQLDTLQ
jgi:hypothetical protein